MLRLLRHISTFLPAMCFVMTSYGQLVISEISNDSNEESFSTYFAETVLGRVVKHRDGLLYETPAFSYIIQGGNIIQTDGSQPWHQYWRFPRLERTAHFGSFGDQDVLGYAFGAAPGISFYLRRKESSAILLQINAGIAYLTREFDAANNPRNNAIGSNVNNTTQIKVSYEFDISHSMMMNAGIGITHYSNGLSSSPNSGINVIGLHLGLKRSVSNGKQLKDAVPSKYEKVRPWGLSMFASYGVSEYVVPGGPKYPIKNYTGGVYYQPNPFLRWHLGADYEYAFGEYEFAIRDFQSEESSVGDATKTAAYAAVEGFFGDVSIRYQMGYYLGLLYPEDPSVPYSKFVIAYHLPYDYQGIRPYAGILLKTHAAVADYVALHVGMNW